MRRILRFFRVNANAFPPYKVMLDGTFIAALFKKSNTSERNGSSDDAGSDAYTMLRQLFETDCRLFVTSCVMQELRQLGKKYEDVTKFANKQRYYCSKCRYNITSTLTAAAKTTSTTTTGKNSNNESDNDDDGNEQGDEVDANNIEKNSIGGGDGTKNDRESDDECLDDTCDPSVRLRLARARQQLRKKKKRQSERVKQSVNNANNHNVSAAMCIFQRVQDAAMATCFTNQALKSTNYNNTEIKIDEERKSDLLVVLSAQARKKLQILQSRVEGETCRVCLGQHSVDNNGNKSDDHLNGNDKMNKSSQYRSECLFVATQDDELKSLLRHVPGVPIISITPSGQLVIEQPSEWQKDAAKKMENYRAINNSNINFNIDGQNTRSDKERKRKLHDNVESEYMKKYKQSSATFRRNRAKAPNPLSVKKKRTSNNNELSYYINNDDNPSKGENEDENFEQKVKRKRRRRRQENESEERKSTSITS